MDVCTLDLCCNPALAIACLSLRDTHQNKVESVFVNEPSTFQNGQSDACVERVVSSVAMSVSRSPATVSSLELSESSVLLIPTLLRNLRCVTRAGSNCKQATLDGVDMWLDATSSVCYPSSCPTTPLLPNYSYSLAALVRQDILPLMETLSQITFGSGLRVKSMTSQTCNDFIGFHLITRTIKALVSLLPLLRTMGLHADIMRILSSSAATVSTSPLLTGILKEFFALCAMCVEQPVVVTTKSLLATPTEFPLITFAKNEFRRRDIRISFFMYRVCDVT